MNWGHSVHLVHHCLWDPDSFLFFYYFFLWQKNEGDVTVIDVRCVPADFHARFKAKERT